VASQAADAGAPSASASASSEIHLAGVDTSALLPRERKEWSGYVGEFLSPCPDVAVSIAQCVQEKRNCAKCLPAAKFILKAVRAGWPRDEVEKAYKNRFDPAAVKNIPVDGSPTIGPDNAQVTIVEFADFECPFCKMEYPVLDQLQKEHAEKIRLIYKVKLLGHPHGEIAARAAISAGAQGKFWEMHHKLFDNQSALEQRDLDKYARELGLDFTKFTNELKSQATSDRIQKDQKLAESLKIDHTPTIYVNGRETEPTLVVEQVGEELGLDIAAKPAPSGSSSAAAVAPSASASSKPAPSTSASASANNKGK
jgi:protein-disulfide isomerase